MASESEERQVTPGSGNVYADFGMVDADEMLAKAKLVRAISHTISSKGLSNATAAQSMGIELVALEELFRGQFRSFSSDRLMHFLNLLGQDVTIFVAPKQVQEDKNGHVNVSLSVAL